MEITRERASRSSFKREVAFDPQNYPELVEIQQLEQLRNGIEELDNHYKLFKNLIPKGTLK